MSNSEAQDQFLRGFTTRGDVAQILEVLLKIQISTVSSVAAYYSNNRAEAFDTLQGTLSHINEAKELFIRMLGSSGNSVEDI